MEEKKKERKRLQVFSKTKPPKKKKEKNSSKLIRRTVQSTQKQIPVKDFINGTILTEDNRLLKMIEVSAIPFDNLKVSQKNMIRSSFENLIKKAPNEFQIKCISMPADLTKQIEIIDKSIEKEKNEECLHLIQEYKNSLKKTQDYNVERKFYLIFSGNNVKKLKQNELNNILYKLDNTAKKMCNELNNMGNKSKVLNNNEIANVFYTLLNRNEWRSEPFEEHYEKVYQRYIAQNPDVKDIYIAPNEYISPKKINFNDSKYIVCNERYYTYLYMNGNKYPTSAVCGWLNMYIDTYEGIDLDIFVRKKEKNATKEDLRKTLGHSELDLNTSGNNVSDTFFNSVNKYTSARLLLEFLMNGKDIYDVSLLFTISGNSLEEVNQKAEYLIDTTKDIDASLESLKYETEKAFISSLPLNYLDPSIENKAKRNIPQPSLATFYPFTTYQLIHDNGIYFADALGNTPAIPDFWDTKFVSNPLVFFCGQAGAGKTSALELIACHARALRIPVFIVAPEKQDDYKRLCMAIGGQFIEIGTGSPYRINIMQVMENDKNVDEEKKRIFGALSGQGNSHLVARIGVVIEFIHTSFTEMTSVEKTILNDALIETYKRFGITEDNESLWADEEHTHYKKMPILSDLVETLSKMGQDANRLMMAVKYLTTGAGAHFNGQTNIDVNNNFFVIGTENNTKETKSLSAFLAEDFCQMKIREDRTTKTVYIIDEGWAMLNNPFTAEKMKEDAKILRGYRCLFIFATQQMRDVLTTEEGQIILNNCDTRIIMKHKDEEIDYVSNHIDITNGEKKMIREFSVGQALMLANQTRLPIYFNPTDYEKLLTWNDPKTLERYAQYMADKKAKEEFEARRRELEARAKLIEEGYDPRRKYKRIVTSEEYIQNNLKINERGKIND